MKGKKKEDKVVPGVITDQVEEVPEKKLTEKQVLFCNEYLIDFNASAAARRAGYSTETAGAIGWENLKKPEIQAFIDKLRKNTADSFNITRERIALEYSRLAFFDPRKMYDGNGNLKAVSDWGDDEAAAIAGLEMEIEKSRRYENIDLDDEGNIVDTDTVSSVAKIKHASKRDALDSLVRLMGYAAPTKTELAGPGGKELNSIPVINLNITAPPAEEKDGD